MSSQQAYFYQELIEFSQFRDVMRDDYYQDAPKDWIIAVADVAGSTQAIEQGRYKDVNVVGASAIIAVLNACGGDNLAYVFGGDGASFVFSPQDYEKVKKALLQTQMMAEQGFDLYLRVGFVPVSELYEAQKRLRIGKYKIAENTYIAMFRGGGLSYADDVIKQNEHLQIRAEKGRDYGVSFHGLECRWNPMQSQKGEILTLMVQSNGGSDIYQDILQKIEEIYQKDAGKPPMNEGTMSLSLAWRKLSQEYHVRTHGLRLFQKYGYAVSMFLQTCLGRFIFAFDLNIAGIKGRSHLTGIINHTDHRKFDDTLRMVLDGSCEDHDILQSYLEDLYQKQQIYYGLERADSALMTCLIFDRQDRHIHFVDGADGGYTYAAKKMKQQMQAAMLDEQKISKKA